MADAVIKGQGHFSAYQPHTESFSGLLWFCLHNVENYDPRTDQSSLQAELDKHLKNTESVSLPHF